METTSVLNWTGSKFYYEDGAEFRIDARVKLADECKNGHCDFSTTCDIYEVAKNGRLIEWGGGANTEAIAAHFPELREFVKLHLSRFDGRPMYAVENGAYFIKRGEFDTAKDHLRITDDELEMLKPYAGDSLYFAYMLQTSGIVARWENEAREFIKWLEEKTGKTWANPYADNEPIITAEDTNTIKERITAGYYTAEAINARNEAKKEEERENARAEVLAEYDATTAKAQQKRDIKLAIIDAGGTLTNVIIYDHYDPFRVVFNWSNCWDKITADEYRRIIDADSVQNLKYRVEWIFKS